MTAPLAWQDLGVCRGMDPDLFFPGRGESTKEAKAACAACPVTGECLDYAMANGEKFGIWGGLSERERRRLRRQRHLSKSGPARIPDERIAHVAALVAMHRRAGDPAPVAHAAEQLGVSRRVIHSYLGRHEAAREAS